MIRFGFGEVLKTGRALNPNTGNPICIWTWAVDHEKFRAYYKEIKIKKLQSR